MDSMATHASAFATTCAALRSDSSPGYASMIRANGSQFIHIPKCGGSTIESFSKIGFQGHRELYLGGPWGRVFLPMTRALRADLITVFRHPVERLLSQYYFELYAGPKTYSGAAKAQHLLCSRGTGVAEHNITCQPKVSFLAYGMDESYRNNRGYDNLQFWYVRPARNSTVGEVRHFLASHFALIGVTERMLEFQVLLAHLFGIAAARVTATVANARSRKGSARQQTARDVLNESEYRLLEERNALDVQLHTWAANRFAHFAHCYGVTRLETQVREALRRPSETRTYA